MAKHRFQTKLQLLLAEGAVSLPRLELENEVDIEAAIPNTVVMINIVLRFLLDEIHETKLMVDHRQISESQMVMRHASLVSDIQRELEPFPHCYSAVKLVIRNRFVDGAADRKFAERFYAGIC
jgi:hypothetical protein